MNPAAQPLSHHEIVTLVAPFARRGRHLDLAASDRQQRRLVFQPVKHAAQDDGLPAVQNGLRLELRASGAAG